MEKKWIALIPAYKPDKALPDLLREVVQAGFEAVVVDDGSGEDFAEIFRQCSPLAVVLTHPQNRGKGRALKTGFAYIQEHGAPGSVLVTLDADGQHKVCDAKRICQVAGEHPDTLVLGSRRLKEHVPLRSRMGNSITRLVYRLSTGLRVHDTQTGLRAFSLRLLPDFMDIPGERYEYEMNVLLECSRRQIPIREVEIETIYIDNNSASHFDTLRDSCRIYKEILKFSASSLVSFVVDYALYSLLLFLTTGWATAGLWFSNIAARVVSASVNYVINRKLVFKSQSRVAKSALQYFALAAAILIGNTLLLGLLAQGLGMNRYLAKICTEIFFFLISWLVQRLFIFRRREKE